MRESGTLEADGYLHDTEYARPPLHATPYEMQPMARPLAAREYTTAEAHTVPQCCLPRADS